jgi:Fe-S cluster assembly iron-binding protein IscA
VLAVTQGAADVIRNIVAAEEDVPPDAGLRIDTGEVSDEGVDLDLAFVEGPEEGDSAVVQDGVNVYLSSDASALLADKILDAHEHGDHVHFEIGEQGADGGTPASGFDDA